MKKKKKKNNHKVLKLIALSILTIIFVLGSSYIIYIMAGRIKALKINSNILDQVKISESEIKESKKAKLILQLEELKKENNDIVGWIEIKDTNINFPVLQTDNNDYYLNHSYKKEYSEVGSIYLDKDVNLDTSSNYLVYGHRTKTKLMFEDLLKYANEDFYLSHKEIKFTTLKEVATYEILAVFYSEIYNKTDENVFRYYYFINALNEEEYNDFVNNAKKLSIYETGVTASYNDQLLTLSTCEYSKPNGRFVVVAKKVLSN